MSRLEFLADDETPGRVSLKKVYTQLVSPLRNVTSTLPKLQLSPASPPPLNESNMTTVPQPPSHSVNNDHAELVGELTASLRASEQLNDELQAQIETMQAQHIKLMTHHTLLNNSISELSEELIESRAFAERVQGQLRAAVESSAALQAKVASLEAQRDEATSTIEALQAEVNSYRGRFPVEELLCKAQVELEANKSLIAQLKRDVERANHERNQFEADKDRAMRTAQQHSAREQEMLSQLNEAREQARNATSNASKQADLLRKKMKTLLDAQKQLEAARLTISSNEGELEKKFVQLTDIADDIERLAHNIAEHGCDGFTARINPRAQLRWVKSTVEHLIRTALQAPLFAKQLDETDERLKSATRQAAEATSKLQDVSAELALKARELDRALDEAATKQSQFDADLARLTQERDAALTQVTELKRHQSDKDFLEMEAQAKIDALAMQHAHESTQLKAANERCAQLESDVSRLQMAIECKLSELAESARAGLNLKQARRALEAEVRSLNEQVAKLTKQKESVVLQNKKLLREQEHAKAPTDLERAAKSFVIRHGGKPDVDLVEALDVISAQYLQDAQEKFALTKQLVTQTERIAFLEAELSVRASSSSPECRAKSVSENPATTSSSPRLLTPKERRALSLGIPH